MLSRCSRVHIAGLLCRSPSASLSALSSSPLLCGLWWLLSAHSNFATKASTLPLCHFSASCIEQTQGTLGRKGWEIKAKAQYSSWGTSLSQGTKPTVGLRGFCLPPAHQLSSKMNIYTNVGLLQPPPRPETISKSGLGQTTS